MSNRILSPSILAADFSRLGEEVRAVEAAGAGYLHLDVMDGAFVPNLTIGPPVIQSLRRVSGLRFDVHLMIEDPDRYLDSFAAAGADLLTVHVEACRHLDRTLEHIRELGCRTGVALNPMTSLSTLDYVLPRVDMVLLMTVNPGFGGQSFLPYSLEKIKSLREALNQQGLQTDIEVDGGITLDNVGEVLKAGANVLVAGSAVFKGSPEENVRAFLAAMERE